MILADDAEGRQAALAKILPMQRDDFVELFEIMARPAGDHPPARPAAARVPAARGGGARGGGQGRRRRASRPCAGALAELHETNPMLGLRGCRLGILFPEIYEMQARAIFEAAVEVEARRGETVVPEVMIPLVGMAARELQLLKERIDAVAAEVAQGDAAATLRLPGRHHDRAAARGAARRRDRRARRVLQLRHQRPHPDDARPLPRRFRQVPRAPTSRAEIFHGDPFQTPRPGTASASWSSSPPSAAARRGPTSSSASAASMAATRPRSRSASGSASTTSPARPTACRSPGWPRPRRRCRAKQTRIERGPLRRAARRAARRRWRGRWPRSRRRPTPRRRWRCSMPPGRRRGPR